MDPQPDSQGLPPDTQEIFDVQEDSVPNSEDEIADLMADPEVVEAEEGESEEESGAVEGIIPPSVDSEEGVESDEEAFSMDDFEEGFVEGENGQEQVAQEESPQEDEAAAFEVPTQQEPSTPSDEGEVAKFRRSLANLAMQAELDRIAFLRESLAKNGDPVPTLEDIAADVKGEKLLFPEGECDLYSRRPNTRLEGWKLGLAFGVPRRAKRFSKG
jgi:hypothetical protein